MTRDESSNEKKSSLTQRKIIYDKNGKPCRSCNTLLDFQFASSESKSLSLLLENVKERSFEDPPDVELLGKSSWTLLHSIAAHYPKNPSLEKQKKTVEFLHTFADLYPCWTCAEDFKKYLEKSKPNLSSQEFFSRWLCDAHNDVNLKLNKKKFNCNLINKRWRDGW